MGGRRPAGAGSVEAPESNTCLPAPDISLVAAVRDWVRRANGPITTNGLQLGRQLETAKEQFATQLTCRGIDENKCILSARPIVNILNLPEECLDATLLCAAKYQELVTALCFGDGTIAVKMNNGNTFVIDTYYNDSYPFYLNY